MIEFQSVDEVPGWFNQTGIEQDVVIASRVRLSRNLADHFFPGTLSMEEENKVQNKILDAFTLLSAEKNYEKILLENLSPTERRMLLERHLISQDYSLQKQRYIVLRKDQLVSAMINEVDHLRLVSFHGGLNL
ncbi:MAG: ATP--guanido phosphotransferase, partial [Spirochaetota bacterium]